MNWQAILIAALRARVPLVLLNEFFVQLPTINLQLLKSLGIAKQKNATNDWLMQVETIEINQT